MKGKLREVPDCTPANIGSLGIVKGLDTMCDIHKIKSGINLQQLTFDCTSQVILNAKIGCKSQNSH